MEANRPAPGPGGYGGLGAGSIVSKNIQPLLEADPRQIGPYAVRGRLGQGAMGSVYLGFAPTGQAFALKVLRQDFAADRDFRKRFAREIAAARAVHSPFVNAVTDADPNAATPWLASYFIPGPPLSAAVQLAGPFSPRSVAHLGVGIGLALQAIHTAGIVHRDLKPANVLVASDGPRVIDFGIARATDASMLTATGMRLGTPSFMAPEQVAGADVDAPADVWAVGGMLIYAATGRTPFGLGDAMAILYRVEHHEPDLEGLEPALAYIAARCLTKDAAARPTPTQLVEMCRAALDGGVEGRPALRGSDVTGWLPSAVSRDLAARAVELANVGQVLPGPGPGFAPVASPTAGAGDTGLGTGAGGRTGGGLGGFLRRKGGGQATSAGSATGAAYSGQPIGQYSQGTAMSGGQGQYGQPDGQTGGGQYGPPPGQDEQDPNGTGGEYGAGAGQTGPGQFGGQQQGAPGQFSEQQQAPGQYGAQQPAPAGQQYGAPAPQGYGPADGGGGAQQAAPGQNGGPQQGAPGQYGAQPPAAPGQFGGQQPAPGGQQYGAPAPQGYGPAGGGAQQPAPPAWGPSGPSGSDMPTIITPPPTPAPEPQEPAWRAATSSHTPAPTPEPDSAGLAGLPAGFTPIGEEAKRLAEAAEAAESPDGSAGFGEPQSAGPSPESAASDAASDVDAAFGPPKPANPVVPHIAEPTFATNFNIPAVTPQPEAGSAPAPAPAPKPSVGIPQIAEPTFATNFNIPVVTAASGESEGTPAPASSGVTVPQIAEPTFATNFNIPVVTATDPNADGDDAPAPRTGPPQVSVPSIAEPGWATGFGMPAVTPESQAPAPDADEDAAPKPVTHAPPIPPHLQQPMTPPPGFGGPATAANRQQPAQQPFGASQPSAQSSPFAPTQIQSPQGQQGFGSPQAPGHAQGAQAQQPFGSAPQQGQQAFGSAPQQGQAQGVQGQQPFGSAPQQGHAQGAQGPQPFGAVPPQQGQQAHQPFGAAPQSPFAPPQGQAQQPYAAQQQAPYAQQQPPQGYQQQPQGFQQQGFQQPGQPQGFQQPHPQPNSQFGYQQQPPAQPQQHNPQAGGMTIVPLPPSMESPYGVPERPHGPTPTLLDTSAQKGWSSWSSTKRIVVLAVAGIVVIGGVVGAILALSGGSSSKSSAPPAAAVGDAAATTAAAAGPIGAQQGAPGARDVVLRGLYGAAAAHDFATVCASQTVGAQQGAAKSAGWNGQGDPMPQCEKYFQDHWSNISADYLRGRQVTDVKPGSAPSTMTVTVNDPPPSGGTTRSFTVVWQDPHWLLEAAAA
ncbi:hypothetical protein ABH920_007808 [Catenulispora sp. EB89]|uniref:protein kinase domain-containing protein n=1 Tax=Catenulispora sp. EB89 TaxID=3156257 RepID=UPI003519D11C